MTASPLPRSEPRQASAGGGLHVSRSASRALDLLETVVATGSVGLGEAADAVHMSPSTALRHLRALEQRGYLQRDDQGRYSPGPTFLGLALLAFQHDPTAHLAVAARPHLDRLVERTGESSYLAVGRGDQAMYLATSEGRRAIRHVGWVGHTVPLAGTAVGAALTSSPPSPRAHVRSGSVEPDVAAAAAPVVGPDGTVIAALSVIGPAHRLVGAALTAARGAVLDEALAFASALGIDRTREAS